MSTPLQKEESMSTQLEQNENVTNLDQDITEKIFKMKLAHTVCDILRNYFIFLCVWISVATCEHVKIVSQTKKQIKNVSNKYLWFPNVPIPVGYKPDEPNHAQQTMYYTLWEMKDMQKRETDEVRQK